MEIVPAEPEEKCIPVEPRSIPLPRNVEAPGAIIMLPAKMLLLKDAMDAQLRYRRHLYIRAYRVP